MKFKIVCLVFLLDYVVVVCPVAYPNEVFLKNRHKVSHYGVRADVIPESTFSLTLSIERVKEKVDSGITSALTP